MNYYYGIFLAAALTLMMELPFFLLFGYRKKAFLLLFLSVNVATNISINLLSFLSFYFSFFTSFFIEIANVELSGYTLLMFFLELLVIAAEYLAFKAMLGKSKKLFWVVVLANAFSGIVGSLLMQWIIV